MFRETAAETRDACPDQGAILTGMTPHPVQTSDLDRNLSILRLLLAEAELAMDSDPERARSALSRAVAVIEADNGGQVVSNGLARWQAKKVMVYIQQEIEKSMRVGELAQITRLSCSHFSRAFRTTFGCTPQKYIVDQRVGRAKQLMITTGMNLCEVALACGFSDQAHLTRVFRSRTGDTPAVWRRARYAQ